MKSIFDDAAEKLVERNNFENFAHMIYKTANTHWGDEYRKLRSHGTNTEIAENNPLSDGDQSSILSLSKNAEFHREIFACGGDLDEIISSGELPMFFQCCLLGLENEVRKLLEACESEEQKKKMLESRIGFMRYSPLFLVITGLHKVKASLDQTTLRPPSSF